MQQVSALEAPQRVLLVAPHESYRIAPYVEAARSLGIEVVVASQGEHSLVAEAARGLHIRFDDPEGALATIHAAAARVSLAAVIGADDATVVLASRAAAMLGLPHNPPEAVTRARRKDLARECLAQARLPVPRYWRIDLRRELAPQLTGVIFPCVVKPLALSASRGVIRADGPDELSAACRRVAAIVQEVDDDEEGSHLLVEQFIPGPEVAVEGLLRNGELEILAVFDKPEPLNGPYFEESYYITPSRHPAPVQRAIGRRIGEACRAYGLAEGPVHAEFRIHKGDAWLLEMASRTIGGQCSRLLRFGTGHGLEALVLAQAVGRPLTTAPREDAAGVLMIPIPRAGILRRVEGVLAAQKVEYVEDVEISVREGYELVPLPEGNSYLGFIFARAPTPGMVEQALRRAHACLNIVTAPVFKIGFA